MKVKKHPQLNLVNALTLTGVRPLETLFVFLFVACFSAYAVPLQETTTPKTFTDWCLNKTSLSVETKHTVDVLLQVAETQDCQQADKTLSTSSVILLYNTQLADLKPLSTLTHLTYLALRHNQVTDLKPLSTLTNLTRLDLSNNQVTDLKPLSTLTNLTELNLSNNQVADLKPLSTLTNLTELSLSNNPTLTDKTCPVKPESICSFAPYFPPSR
jgi:internalin A